LNFKWDAKKASSNLIKHGISFFEALEIFNDELAVTVLDPDHSAIEHRYLAFGVTSAYRRLVVSYTEHEDTIRIISARTMTPRERKAYEE
jgi:uncharacterized DUF497 family protein